MLPKNNRFRSDISLKKIIRRGKKVRSQHLLLMYDNLESAESAPKFAIGLSKKLKKRGVHRNRLRRQLYQAISEVSQTDTNVPVGKGYFLLLLAIPEGKSYQLFVSELKELIKKIG